MKPNENTSCESNTDEYDKVDSFSGNISRNINEEINRLTSSKRCDEEEKFLESSENLVSSDQRPTKYIEKPKFSFFLRFLSFTVITFFAFICYINRPTQECFDHENRPGSCKFILDCPFALKDILLRKKLVICPNKDKRWIICCEDKEDIPDLKSRFILPEQEHNKIRKDKESIVFQNSFEDISECPQPPHSISKPEKQRVSVKKCLEYQEKLVYPCRESIAPSGGMVRLNRCKWKPTSLIISGENAYYGEFPHMALLGFKTDKDIDRWKCGGSIISDRFILTAAHCTYTPSGGNVAYVRIGILNKSEEITPFNTYNVMKIYKHENYKSPSEYHDIALLETDKPMKLHPYAVPACLHDGSPINDLEVIATGWGTTKKTENYFVDTLQKTTLDKFSNAECAQNLAPLSERYLKKGYDKHIQICYGDKHENRDTCRGDSGGPTQIKHPNVTCMYLITGITSSGKYCGVTGSPGLYTRVGYYLDWIESIVWRTN